jgi:HAD superfamily hydrolase (TIGR01509 family)
MIHAIIFDFDGLIVDTESPIYQSWQEMYAAYGQPLPLERWSAVIGTYEEPFDPFADLEKLVGRQLDRQALLRQRGARETELVAQQSILPGVEQYLQDARRLGIKTAVASSSKRQWVVSHLERLGLLHFFDAVRVREDVKVTKPDPELFLSALSGLGITAQQAIALEDSPNGITAARRAGLFCVAVPNDLTRHLRLEHADLQVKSLADTPLEALLEIVNERMHSAGVEHE